MNNIEDTQKQDVFKVLTIDGGGIKGLFSAKVLSEIERVNGSVAEHFDMLCGTSTGGLIALALAAGRSAAEIVEFYRVWGPQIFPERNAIYRFLRKRGLLITNSRNSDKVLTKAVDSIIGDKRMQDSNSYLCIPTLSLINTAPYVFKTDHDATLNRDAEVLMKDAALATAAAPFYFPVATPSHLAGGEFVDGGLWANNPALIGLIEAGRFFVGEGKPYKKLKIFSLASISPAAGRAAGGKRRLRVPFSVKEVFTATLESQQKATEFAVKFLIPSLKFPVDYIRIPSPAVSVEHSAHIELDSANQRSLQTLEYYGIGLGSEWNSAPEIKAFFADKALPPKFRKV